MWIILFYVLYTNALWCDVTVWNWPFVFYLSYGSIAALKAKYFVTFLSFEDLVMINCFLLFKVIADYARHKGWINLTLTLFYGSVSGINFSEYVIFRLIDWLLLHNTKWQVYIMYSIQVVNKLTINTIGRLTRMKGGTSWTAYGKWVYVE